MNIQTLDSGHRLAFDSGMERSTDEGKINYLLTRDGPMFKRWAELLTRGARMYSPRNWTKASGEAEFMRFMESASRHFEQWVNQALTGEPDGYDDDGNPFWEDHAAAVFFNVNGAEYVKEKMSGGKNGRV